MNVEIKENYGEKKTTLLSLRNQNLKKSKQKLKTDKWIISIYLNEQDHGIKLTNLWRRKINLW